MEGGGSYFIIVARQLVLNNNWKNAFVMYLSAFDKQPELKERHDLEFRITLSEMNEQLAANNHIQQIFSNLERAIKVFPNDVNLLNDVGNYLFKYQHYSHALTSFGKALNLDHSLVAVEKNLNKAKRAIFPRSVYRMLNDKTRNEAFKEAIRRVVTSATDTVIDIDAGSGLLALYAKECKPMAITVCETLPSAKVAESVMNDNDANDIFVFNKPRVNINDDDININYSVLLTAMIDGGLIGEYILQTLSYAWENFLHNKSKVIPGKGEYFVVGVQCDQLNNKYKLSDEAKDILNLSDINVHTTTIRGETYSDEDVQLYDHLKYVTEPVSLFKIDFNNHNDVREKLHSQEHYLAELLAKEDGNMNLMIGWFDLHLTDGVTITSNPTAENKCAAWPQAIFFDVLPKKLRKNDITTIPFSTYGGTLNTIPDKSNTVTRISAETVAFLNDSEYMKMIANSVATACVHLGQITDISSVDIVDLSPFPLFGVLMLRRGAHSLMCHVKTNNDKIFLQSVLKANEIAEDRLTILVSEYQAEAFKLKKFHVIFCNVIDFSGDINISNMRKLRDLKNYNLIHGGLCLPANVSMVAQLINSYTLETNNRLLDENVLGYKMAKHVNMFQVSRSLYLDASKLEYTPLSEEFEISVRRKESEVIKVFALEDGECTGILCWYKIQLLDEWNEIYTNRPNSFLRSVAYLTESNVRLFRNDEINVLKCADNDGSFKLVLDLEPY